MAVLAAATVVVYVVLWIGWRGDWTWLTATDDWVLTGAHRYGIDHPTWVLAWNTFCTLLGPSGFRLLALPVIIWMVLRRNLRSALFLVLTVEFSTVVANLAKVAANRPRPSVALVSAQGSAFPSGHAVGVMVGVLALSTVTLPLVPERYRRPLAVVGAAVVLSIGAGRVVLAVHHPSDVLAGWALGYAYYVLCLALVRPVPTAAVTAEDETPEAPDTPR